MLREKLRFPQENSTNLSGIIQKVSDIFRNTSKSLKKAIAIPVFYLYFLFFFEKNQDETFFCEFANFDKTGFNFKKKSTKYNDLRMNISSRFYVPAKFREINSKNIQEKYNYNKDLSGFSLYSSIFQAIFENSSEAEEIKTNSKENSKITSNFYKCFDQVLNTKMTQVPFNFSFIFL